LPVERKFATAIGTALLSFQGIDFRAKISCFALHFPFSHQVVEISHFSVRSPSLLSETGERDQGAGEAEWIQGQTLPYYNSASALLRLTIPNVSSNELQSTYPL
jgi:hypothetical protein